VELQYLSDLHLEFNDNQQWLLENMPEPAADILILAGDVVCFSAINRAAWFFYWASKNFTETYWIPGNHEYYYSSIETPTLPTKRKVKHNVTLINNASIEIDDVVIHFSTLWTAIPEMHASVISRGMSDYHLIKINGEYLSPADVNTIHLHSMRFLVSALGSNRNKKQFVVTHHVPTLTNYPQEFIGSALNAAFAVELAAMINQFKPKAWIFGHTHRNVPGFSLGITQMKPTNWVTSGMTSIMASTSRRC